jgi:hypothetical protein
MNHLSLVAAAAFTLISGSARAETPPTTTAGKEGPMGAMHCPMGVQGTKVATAPTASGATLTFTASPEQVVELRHRVQQATEMHNKNHASGGMRGDMDGDGMMGGMNGEGMMGGTSGGQMMGSGNVAGHMAGGQMMPQSRATMTEMDHGATITLTPTDPAELKKLQAAVAVRAERMQQHGCGQVSTR